VDRYTFDVDGRSITRKAGDKWLFYGPKTYIPQCEVRVIHTVRAELVKPNQALKLEAISNFTDRDGIKRSSGEQWVFGKEGSFIPDIYEKVVERINGIILTDHKAIHVEALVSFEDPYTKQERKAGDTWRVTKDDTEVYIPPVQARVINNNVQVTTLTNREFLILEHPYDDNNKPQFGKKEIRKGERSFFLHPNEVILERKKVIVLTAEEAIEVQALRSFKELQENEKGGTSTVNRIAGEKWLVCGPKEYWPPAEVVYNENIRKRALLIIDALNIRLFKLDKLILYIFAVLFGLYLIVKLFRG
jgi:major vault protein